MLEFLVGFAALLFILDKLFPGKKGKDK